MNVTQLGIYGNSTYLYGAGTPPMWYYDIATGRLNTRFYAPILATNDQTYIFTGWSGCNAVEDNFKADWSAGTDNVAETCVVDRNAQANIEIKANYSQTKLRVVANSYKNTDSNVNNIRGTKFASSGVSGNPQTTIPTSLGVFGGVANTYEYGSSPSYPNAGLSYTVAATTISTEIYASLKAPNEASDPLDDYNFVEWSNCQNTEDKFDANWNLTTTYGGTAAPDGIKETCVVNYSNGLINSIIALYSGDLVRVNINAGPIYDQYHPVSSISNVKILQIPYGVPAPSISDPNTYSPATLGTDGGLTNYVINRSNTAQIRLVAPFRATNNPGYEFDSWYSYNSGCTSTEDNYTANFALGTDGVRETCVYNITSPGTFYVTAIYKQTHLIVKTTTLNGNDPDYNSIYGVKILDANNVTPTPSSMNPNLITTNYGKYGGITTQSVPFGNYFYDVGNEGTVRTKLIAPINIGGSPSYDFDHWNGCASTEDNYDSLWNAGTDGRFETCIVNFSNGSSNTVNASYTNHITRLRVVSGIVSGGSLQGSIDVRDIGLAGTPTPDHNPSTNPVKGTFGGTTQNYLNSSYYSSYYDRLANGTGGLNNGIINTRLVASFSSSDKPGWKFSSWQGCESVADNYDSDFNYGVSDGIFETCTVNFRNGQANSIVANYQLSTLTVRSSTPSGYDPDFNAIDHLNILEHGYGNPSQPVVDPNSLTLGQLGTFGGNTSTPYYYSAYNNVDWYYVKQEGYIHTTRLLAPLYSTTNHDYGFVEWRGCVSVEDNYNGLWQPGNDGVAETCVVRADAVGGSTVSVTAIYDDARTAVHVNSNVGSVLVTSPDPKFDGKVTNYNVLEAAINTTLRVPEFIATSPTQTKVFSSWTGCNSTQDLYKTDGTLGSDGISETCTLTPPDSTTLTISANYTNYDYSFGVPYTDQPTIAKNTAGTTITSSTILENSAPIIVGTPCTNTFQYIEPYLGVAHVYTSTINNLSRCETTIPVGDIPDIGKVSFFTTIPTLRGRTFVSPSATRYLIDQVYTNTLYAYYDAGHPNVSLNGGTILTDLSGRGNDGLLGGSSTPNPSDPTFNSTGIKSWSFNGTDQFIRSGLASNYSTDVSFEVWYQRDSTARSALVSQYRATDTINRLALTNDNDKLSVKIDQNTYQTGSFISSNFWQMGTITYNTTDNTIAIYANGVLQNVFNAGTLFAPSTSPIDIGKSVLSDYFSGNIGEVRMYNSALPEITIRSNFEAQKAKYGFTDPKITMSAVPLNVSFGTHPFSSSIQSGANAVNNTTYLDRRAISSGWNATIAMTNFVNTADATKQIAASSLSITPSVDPRLMGSPLFVTYGITGNLSGANTPKTLINVNQFNGSGQYQLDQGYTVTIPGYTPPGNYESTITLTTTTY